MQKSQKIIFLVVDDVTEYGYSDHSPKDPKPLCSHQIPRTIEFQKIIRMPKRKKIIVALSVKSFKLEDS